MPRLHDHVWSYPSAGAARPYSLPRGMIAAALCPQGPGAPEPEPAPRGQREGTAGFSARPGSWHHDLVQRSLVLFSFGVVLALVLNLLQIQRNVTLFPDEVIATIFSSAWWVPPCCGTAAAVVGLLYPCIDSHLGEPHKFKREWASVMRCIAVFVGINHASAVSSVEIRFRQ
ncbi:insulin-induced gene 1 protein isoform X2 [Rattus norvegicus]|uniref:insulin-induced gene 1 protein isoform X2 n=1 Tax=Rattus norvegicus TaxID=10116 RepID=UPI002FD8416E